MNSQTVKAGGWWLGCNSTQNKRVGFKNESRHGKIAANTNKRINKENE
jgi:hypothetical protein